MSTDVFTPVYLYHKLCFLAPTLVYVSPNLCVYISQTAFVDHSVYISQILRTCISSVNISVNIYVNIYQVGCPLTPCVYFTNWVTWPLCVYISQIGCPWPLCVYIANWVRFIPMCVFGRLCVLGLLCAYIQIGVLYPLCIYITNWVSWPPITSGVSISQIGL